MMAFSERLPRGRAINGQLVENLVLLGIPEKEFSILAPHLDHLRLENGAVLEREGARIDEVFFIKRGIALMVVETIEGRSVEVGIIGRGSMVGLQAAAGMAGLYPWRRLFSATDTRDNTGS